MKNFFEEVEMEVISFAAEDIITASPATGGGSGSFDGEEDIF